MPLRFYLRKVQKVATVVKKLFPRISIMNESLYAIFNAVAVKRAINTLLYYIDNYAHTVEVLFEKGTKSCYRCEKIVSKNKHNE